MINFVCTILYVNNVQKSVDFYKNVFGFKTKFMTPKKNYGEITLGEITIAFASMELANYNLKNDIIENNVHSKPSGAELVFSTENVDDLMEKAKKAGAMEVKKTMLKPWRQKVGYLKDNNGFLIEISTPR